MGNNNDLIQILQLLLPSSLQPDLKELAWGTAY
jgi:hypothetical protein